MQVSRNALGHDLDVVVVPPLLFGDLDANVVLNIWNQGCHDGPSFARGSVPVAEGPPPAVVSQWQGGEGRALGQTKSATTVGQREPPRSMDCPSTHPPCAPGTAP